jgi:hypothetical protein
MKFGMDIMPLGNTQKLYFLIFYSNTDIADKQTCEVGVRLVPFEKGHTVMYGYRLQKNIELCYSNSLNNVK